MGTSVTMSGRGPEGIQSHHVQVSLRCGTEYPGHNGPQVRTRVKDLGEAQLGSESTVPGEAKKESTAIRSRWGKKSPGLGEAQMGTQIHQDQVIPRW